MSLDTPVNYGPGTYEAALEPGARVASPTGAAGEGPGRTNVMATPSPENLERLGALRADGTRASRSSSPTSWRRHPTRSPRLPPSAPSGRCRLSRQAVGRRDRARPLSLGRSWRRPEWLVEHDGAMAYDEDLANRIRELVAGEPDVTEMRMFGGLAFLVGGNMSVAASGQGGLIVRVGPEDTDALVGKPHAQRFEMRGRAMQGWLRVDAEGVRTKRQLEGWVRRGVAYARSLSPKR